MQLVSTLRPALSLSLSLSLSPSAPKRHHETFAFCPDTTFEPQRFNHDMWTK
jgi:hypothetical protein